MATQSKIGWRRYVSPIQYTLDKYSGSAAAYSLRKLRVGYTGSAIRVRRSSDNAETDIGFNSSNDLDTTALTAFVGSGNGFVTTWYDQSGNSKNAIQTTANNQPQIVSSGVVTLSNGKAAISFTGGRFVSASVPRTNNNEAMSMYAIYRLYSTTRQFQFGWGSTELEPGANSNGIALHQFGSFAYSPNNAAYWSTNLALGSVVFTGGLITNNTIYYNGVARSSSITNGGNGNMLIGGTITIGRGSASNANSAISELIFYPNGSQNSNVALINNDINSYYSIYPPTVSDTDAQEFINAAVITNSTQATAVNTLVTDLKTAGLWTKMKAIYPFVGGNANAHKFNLKDPRDTNAAFRLSFLGGMSHTSNGAVPNGINAYAQTFLTPSVTLTSSQHVSFYSMTNRGSTIAPTSNEAELGALSGGTGIPGIMLALNSRAHNSNNSNHYLARLSGGGYGSYGLTPLTDTRGFALLSRTDLNSVKAFWNGSYYGQTAQSYIALPLALTMFYAHYSNSYSFKTCGFATIGDGLNDAESTALYTIIQAYQTALGRNV